MDGDQGLAAVGDRYTVERALGRGASAVVYLARDSQTEQRVAVKLLHEEFAGSRVAERFAMEILLLRKFSHSNIVTVLDSGTWNGRPFYVMQYVDGESLHERLKRERRLPLAEAVRIGELLCAALAYAHEHGVVHRDVKPANVMLAGTAVYLADFGIAKALAPLPGQLQSTTGVARGTRAYMSPEQAMADRDIDHRSDIYSLGCVLYEVVAGQHPFQSADESRTLAMRFTEAPEPMRRHRDGVPAKLEAALLRALEREPADRWQTVDDFREAISEAVASATSPSDGAASPMRIARGRPRHRRWRPRPAALAGLALLLGGWWAASRSNATSPCSVPQLGAMDSPSMLLLPTVAPAANATDVALAAAIDEAMVQALQTWEDVRIVHAASAAAPEGESVTPSSCAMANTGAHFAVAARVEPVGSADSMRLRITVADAAGERVSTALLGRSGLGNSAVIRASVVGALRPRSVRESPHHVDSVSRSFRGWRNFHIGRGRLLEGSIDSATVWLRRSVEAEGSLATAAAWLALALHLQEPRRPTLWGDYARRALEDSSRLSHHDRRVSKALSLRSQSRFAGACAVLRKASDEDSSDYLLLFSLAECLRADSTLIGSPPASLRFASSWAEAQRVLTRAVERAPAPFERFALARLATLSPNSPSIRLGWTPDARVATYAAYPELLSDTIAHRPVPRERIHRSEPEAVPETLGLALQRGKELQMEYARRWASRDDSSGAAHLALALAFELNGRLGSGNESEASALQQLDQAEHAPQDAVPPYVLRSTRIRLLAKTGSFRALNHFVDSLLARPGNDSDDDAAVLGAAALLIGRVSIAADLLQRATLRHVPIPMSETLRRLYGEFLALSGLTCCQSRLTVLEDSLRARLRIEVDSLTRRTWEDRLMTKPLMLGAACGRWDAAFRTSDSTDVILRIQRLLARGDSVATLQALERLTRDRRIFAAGDIAVDYVVQQSLLHFAVGDSIAALRALAQWTSALPVSGALELTEWSQAAALARLLVVAKDLNIPPGQAASPGDAADGSLAALWSGADRWLQEVIELPNAGSRMCSLIPNNARS